MSALTRPVTLLLSGLLLLTVCIAVLNTLVPLWLSHEQYSLCQAGLVTSAFFTGNLGGTLLAAPAIRRWGFNRTYYLATAIFAVATFALYVSHSFIGWSLWRFLAGCGCALIWLVVESALLCSGTSKNRGRMLAAYMIVYYLGTVLGQLFISYLSVTFSEVIPVLLALMAVAILPMIFFRGQGSEEPAEPAPGIIPLLLRRHSRLGINGCIISGIVLGSLYGLLPLWLTHRGWSDSSVGYWMALLISAGIISQWPIGRLADLFGRLLVLRVQVFVVMLGSLAMLTGASMPVVLFILGSSGFTLYPVAMTWACECVPRHELITMNQVLLLSYTTGSLVGPALTSLLMERWSDNLLFAMIAGVAMLYLMMLLRKGNHQATPVARA